LNKKTKRRHSIGAPVFAALWLATLGILAYVLVAGRTTLSSDGRRAVQLTPTQRDLVLEEMRALLTSVHEIHGAVARGDYEAGAQAARASGMQMVEEAAAVEAGLIARLPAEMKALGISTHRHFDQIAGLMDRKAEPRSIFAELHGLTAKCVACHATYRLE
jgi:hypothetical protein